MNHWHVFCLASACLMASGGQPAKADGPTLSQTLDWMESTYNPHNGGSFGYGLVTLKGGRSKRISDTFSYDGCEIEITSQTDYFGELHTTGIYKFNLSDMDPQSLSSSDTDSEYYGSSFCGPDGPQFTCDAEETDFETTNKRPLIDEDFKEVFPKLSGKDHESGGKSKTFVVSLHFSNIDYAHRFTKALLHAINLCGGKPSVF